MTESFDVSVDVTDQLPYGTVFNGSGQGFDTFYYVVMSASVAGILAERFDRQNDRFVKSDKTFFITWQYAAALEIYNG
ncbi:hypothetical protein [Nonomuraea sp. NPDC049141]|uniref:hypothetical protein n=1 Tax=Nonomuraea sp. NPDC049141 TaxID=3155500 RepID=UPI0033C00DC1